MAAIDALRPEWDELHNRTVEATGFQSFAWCRSWIDATRGDPRRKPKIVVVRASGRMAMLWPLQIERGLGLRWARSLGQPMTQYSDALAEPGVDRSVCRALAEGELRKRQDVDLLFMSQVRRDGVLARQDVATRRPSSRAPYVILSDAKSIGRDTYTRSIRRREARLAREGHITLESPLDPDRRRDFAAYVLTLKEDWVRRKGHISLSVGSPLSRRFLTTLARTGFLEVHLLKVGQNFVAGDLGFVSGHAYRSLLSAYDQRFAFGSPGHVLTRLLIQQCRSRGLGCLDLLAPADANKMRVANATIDIDYVCMPLTRRGHVGVVAVAFFRPFLETFRVGKEQICRSLRRYCPSERVQDPGAKS